MNLFSNKLKEYTHHDKISLKEVESKIEDRLKEKYKLDQILKGMRSEVASMMEQIKNLSDKLVDYKKQKVAIENNIECLNNMYLSLSQNYYSEKEEFFIQQDRLSKLKKQISNYHENNERIISLKNQYELLKQNITKENDELNKLKEERLLLVIKENSSISTLDKNMLSKKKLKRCSAKTTSGHKCKNNALDGTDYCHFHSLKKARVYKTNTK